MELTPTYRNCTVQHERAQHNALGGSRVAAGPFRPKLPRSQDRQIVASTGISRGTPPGTRTQNLRIKRALTTVPKTRFRPVCWGSVRLWVRRFRFGLAVSGEFVGFLVGLLSGVQAVRRAAGTMPMPSGRREASAPVLMTMASSRSSPMVS